MPFARGCVAGDQSAALSRACGFCSRYWKDARRNVVCSVMFEDHEHLFPRAENVPHFAIPFLKLMFAHANFEEVFRDMQKVVANDETFSENGKNRWTAKDRPEKMRQLMTEHGCKSDEIATAHRVLTDAFPLCNDRNLLAHGDWWHFDTKTSEITVQGDRPRAGEEQHREFSAETLTQIAERLDDLEVELWRVKRAIEQRASDHNA
jgi:hypothetical protein